MLVAIVVADGLFSSGSTSLHDTLSVAEVLRVKHGLTTSQIRVLVAGEQPIVRPASGLALPTTARPNELAGADVIVVPALGCLDEDDVLAALGAPTTARLTSALAALADRGPR